MVRGTLIAAIALAGCDLSLTGFQYACDAGEACPSGYACSAAGICESFTTSGTSVGSLGTNASTGASTTTGTSAGVGATSGTGAASIGTSSSSSGTTGVSASVGSTTSSGGPSAGATTSGVGASSTGGATLTLIAGRRDTFGLKDGAAIGTAEFNFPGQLVSAPPILYVADTENDAIRAINLDAGLVSTLDGGAVLNLYPSGLVAENAQTLLLAGLGLDALTLAGDAVTSLSSGTVSNVFGLAYDADAGLVYLSDNPNNCIDVVNLSNHAIAPFAGNCGAAGDYQDGPADGGALFNGPWGLALDSSGALYVGDTANFLIRVVRGGQVTTLAGNPGNAGLGSSAPMDGEGLAAQFAYPRVLVVDAHGTLLVGDGSAVRKVMPQSDGGYWVTTPYANNPLTESQSGPVEIYGLALDEPSSTLFLDSISDNQIYSLTGF